MKHDDAQKFELLADLAKLMQKYGPDTFVSLATALSDKKLIESFENILSILATQKKLIQRTPVTSTPKINQVSIRDMIDRIGQKDKEKAALLREVIDAVKNRSLMPQLSDMRLYFLNNGIDPARYNSRDTLTREFFKFSISLSNSDLKELLNNKISKNSPNDRDLGAWAKVILKDEKNK